MSWGFGCVQRKIGGALAAEPSRRFTYRELADAVWPGEIVEDKHMASLCRALKKVPHFHTRVGKRGGLQGWFHRVSASS